MTSAYVAEPAAGDKQAGAGHRLLTSKREALRHLRTELGISGPQAHALFVAYSRDLADATRIGNTSSRSDASFVAWLMEQVPGGRKPRIRRFAVGDSGWRTSS